MNKNTNKIAATEFATEAKPLNARTEIHFQDTDKVSFTQTSDGMTVTVKAAELPEFDGVKINMEYIEFLREQGVGDMAIDIMWKAMEDGLRKGLAFDALMSTMK